jgi:hypothetical protein
MLVGMREKREAWMDHRPSSSNGQAIEKQWTELWRTQVPPKVKMFLWRLAKQSLPTNDVRHHRHMAEDDRCQFCGEKGLLEACSCRLYDVQVCLGTGGCINS